MEITRYLDSIKWERIIIIWFRHVIYNYVNCFLFFIRYIDLYIIWSKEIKKNLFISVIIYFANKLKLFERFIDGINVKCSPLAYTFMFRTKYGSFWFEIFSVRFLSMNLHCTHIYIAAVIGMHITYSVGNHIFCKNSQACTHISAKTSSVDRVISHRSRRASFNSVTFLRTTNFRCCINASIFCWMVKVVLRNSISVVFLTNNKVPEKLNLSYRTSFSRLTVH